MPKIFHYQGRDATGNIVAKNIEANNIAEVVTRLKKFNITPLKIEPVKQLPPKLDNLLVSLHSSLFKIEPFHIMNFCRQLAALHNAGLTIIKAINKLSQSASSHSLSVVLSTVAKDISAGITLADALKKHPEVFSSIMINIVNIGENTGHLTEALEHMARYIEASIANHRRLMSAIRYPIFVLITVTAALLVMNFLVIPKFAVMFDKFQLQLPLATRIIIGSSNLMLNYKYFIIIAMIFTFFGWQKLLKIPGIHYLWDKYKLRIPIFGDLQQRITLSQFTWTFSLIISSGVPIIKGIELASNSTTNSYFSLQLMKMKTAIENGESLSQAAIATGLFTPITIQMIEVGEESQKLDKILSDIAKYYDDEIDYDLKRLNELIEPVLLLLIGGMILILALGIYFPMWDLIKMAKI